MRWIVRLVLSGLVAATAAAPAQAALVRYAFTAKVNQVVEYAADTGAPSYLITSTLPGIPFSHGDSWTGTLTYDDALDLATYQPEQPPGGSSVVYQGAIDMTLHNSQTGFSYRSQKPEYGSPFLIVDNNASVSGWDGVHAVTYGGALYGPGSSHATASFSDPTGTALEAPVSLGGIRLEDFLYRSLWYHYEGADQTKLAVHAMVTSLTRVDVQSPVPEPSTYAMLGMGLAALAMTKRFRRA